MKLSWSIALALPCLHTWVLHSHVNDHTSLSCTRLFLNTLSCLLWYFVIHFFCQQISREAFYWMVVSLRHYIVYSLVFFQKFDISVFPYIFHSLPKQRCSSTWWSPSQKLYLSFFLSIVFISCVSTMLLNWTRSSCVLFLLLVHGLVPASVTLSVWHISSCLTDYTQVFGI